MNLFLKIFVWRKDIGMMLLLAFSFTNLTFARQSKNKHQRGSSSNFVDFSIPEINFEEWILRQSICGSNLPSIKRDKAASDILSFTKEFRNLYKMKLSNLSFEKLRKFSFTINKSVDFLNKFPKFAKKLLLNLSTIEDIQFMENVLDMFAVLEKWRHLLLEKMYHHIEELSLSETKFGNAANRFESLLFGFRNHIRNEREYLKEFIRLTMEPRIDNIEIPSRYRKGALPGLDHIMNDLNISSPLQMMTHSLYRISLPDRKESCIVQTSDDRPKIKTSQGLQNCLSFRFTESLMENDYYLQIEDNKTVRLRPLFSDVIFSNQPVDELGQFRILKLSNGNHVIASRLKNETFFLARNENSDEIQIINNFCPFTNIETNIEWNIFE